MATDRHAKLFRRIWRDPQWKRLTVHQQWLYECLISQDNINNAGVIPLTVRRWVRLADCLTVNQIELALDALAASSFILVDRESEEILVRTYIRNDEIWKRPQLLRAALEHVEETQSSVLRRALHGELRTLEPMVRSAKASGVPASVWGELADEIVELSASLMDGTEPIERLAEPRGTLGEPYENLGSAGTADRPTRETDKRTSGQAQDLGKAYETLGLAQDPVGAEDLVAVGYVSGEQGRQLQPATTTATRRIAPRQTRADKRIAALNETARSAPADKIARGYGAWAGGGIPSEVLVEVAQEVDQLLDDQIDPAQIANGIKAWHASDRLYPSQIPGFVAKAARTAPEGGKPTRKATTHLEAAEQVIAAMGAS